MEHTSKFLKHNVLIVIPIVVTKLFRSVYLHAICSDVVGESFGKGRKSVQ